jgi:hypothetical protein
MRAITGGAEPRPEKLLRGIMIEVRKYIARMREQ